MSQLNTSSDLEKFLVWLCLFLHRYLLLACMLTSGYYSNLWFYPIIASNFLTPVIFYKDYEFHFSVKGEMWEFTITTDYFMEVLTGNNTIFRIFFQA